MSFIQQSKKNKWRRRRYGGVRRGQRRGSVKQLSRSARRRRRARLKKKVTRRKRCPNGTRRNKVTMKCEPKVKQAQIASPAAPAAPTLHLSKQPWEYSPTVNKVLHSLKTRSPDAQIFGCAVEEIAIPYRNTRKCVRWESKAAQTAMLRNLNSKKPIVCSNIIAPKQLRGNCWFNTFFMCCFISDKGRKFFRFLRQTMITGKLPNGTSVPEKLKWPLFLMNKCVDASLRGEDDATRYAWLMDTNLIIKNIYRALTPKEIKQYDMPKVGDAGNPFLFYAGLIQLLTGMHYESRRSILTVQEFNNVTTSHIESRLSWFFQSLPSIIAYELDDDYSKLDKMKRPLELNFRHRGHAVKYVLDSVMLRDISKRHFTAYITCDGKDYSFDGASFSRLEPFAWREKLNKDEVWIFKVRRQLAKLKFNFKSGYQMLLYYRVK